MWYTMGDSTTKDRSIKKSRNGVGCLLLRRSRRRASSEPPKGKRHDRQASRRTIKPSKIARDEKYRTGRNSESDSGFLSFESGGGIKTDERLEYISVNSNEELRHDDCPPHGLSKNFKLKSGRLSSCEEQVTTDFKSSNEADIVNLNGSFSEFGDDDITYDSDSMSMSSRNICFRCHCVPRIFKSRNSSQTSHAKRTRSLGSQSLTTSDDDGSVFNLRTNVLRKISDSIHEGQRDTTVGNTESDDTTEQSKCYLNLIYSEHRCVDSNYCNKLKFAALNAHLRTLIDCMPKSYCDCESKVKWTNCILTQAGYISQRRNAICETNDQSKKTICKAICNYMTLKALMRYDLL